MCVGILTTVAGDVCMQTGGMRVVHVQGPVTNMQTRGHSNRINEQEKSDEPTWRVRLPDIGTEASLLESASAKSMLPV